MTRKGYSEVKKIQAGVPQGSVLDPVPYQLSTSDISTSVNNRIATFADDTAILAVGKYNAEATEKLTRQKLNKTMENKT